ncbi:cysteine dioxygenase family protein [Natronospira bacteriovora]|uniref:Cysteine dioxygenase family protein n=1 Tax=Natronospira bacteriovora TaxID=3069753 RepID=A0ABU0W407_9GAMM|nr:cysteine dioxygenase family protein [Natronospira sp. AB-CW4]MDQ2068702.1 cysteine dioxygenase family protein [Natronospira sp. AB-CW4]
MTTEYAVDQRAPRPAEDFPGARALIDGVSEAAALNDPDAITEAVKNRLCRLISSPEFQLPASFLEAEEDHYARRLVYRAPDDRFSIVAMTWGVGQGTPLHDHSGLWCVEGVCHGRIRIEQYSHRESRGDQDRFRLEEVVTSEVGGAGCLIPPHDHHRILNDREDDVAVTLHIYGGEMNCCNVFLPRSGDWYQRERRSLSYD